MKKFYEDLKEHAKELINYGKKELIPLTYEENKSYHTQKVCHICKKEFSTDNCNFSGKYRRAAHDIYNLNYKAPKEKPVVFHNASPYDCRFIVKELAEEFKEQFQYLGKNTEKCITFSVPIKNNNCKKYKIKLIDSFKFMSSSLSNLVDNLPDGLYNDKCIDCQSYLECMLIKDD